eukprot:TRINITY_DN600_c0_g1_i4.p1 TRINITY_DN600_c0_g1~~TRINITY_DN600_c0_g1_i4.p1  ORF type:complete len:150 (-),score=8.15 TRINITY_DN600_c0_g1_i4:316-765(-)
MGPKKLLVERFLMILLVVLLCQKSYSAAEDENICDTSCEFCCRQKQCRSKSECEGDFSALKILAIVVGCIVAIILLRCAYVRLREHLSKKKANPNDLTSEIGPRGARKGSQKKTPNPGLYINVDSVFISFDSVLKQAVNRRWAELYHSE